MENEQKEKVLSVKDLRISFKTDDGLVHAVRGVTFDLYRGETLCIVGESGSGKSVTSKTIMGILPASAIIEKGEVLYEGEDLTKIAESEFHRIRGHKIGMIFQDPLSSLNPIKKVGKQITEAMLVEKNRVKVYRDRLLSKEMAAYKNRRVQRDSEILAAKNSILSSDSDFEDQIKSAQNALDDQREKVLSMSRSDEGYSAEANRYQVLKEETARTISQLKKKKREEHRRLLLEKRKRIRAAKESYRKDIPVLKQKLDAKKKEADVEAKKYRKEKTDLYHQELEKLAKERESFVLAHREERKQDAINNRKAPSRTLAEQAQAEKEKAYREQLRTFDERKEKIEEDYAYAVHLTAKVAKKRALSVMREVGIPQPEIRFNQYPFEFSGGMRQRIVIAIALTADPEILICDEPTTALDVTIQAQILELINRIKEARNMSIIFITHDLGVVANMADRVAVMYAGKIVEVGTVNEIFYDPRHPYTWALLSSIPDLDSKESLEAIPGTPPYLLNPPKGDAFATRNKYALAIDFKEEPPFFQVTDTHYAATWLLDKRAPKAVPPAIVRKRIHASLERAGIHHEQED